MATQQSQLTPPALLFPTYKYNPHGTTHLATVNSVVKSFFGVGCLALPLLFHDGGIILASVLLIVLACIAMYAIRLLMQVADIVVLTEARQNMLTRLISSQQVPQQVPQQLSPSEQSLSKQSLNDTTEEATTTTTTSITRITTPFIAPFQIIPTITDKDITPEDREGIKIPTLAELGYIAHPKIGFLTNLAIVIGQFGCTCAYLIFISTNLASISGLPRNLILLLCLPPSIILIMIPDLGKLAFVGVVGNITYVIALVIIFYIGFTMDSSSSNPIRPPLPLNLFTFSSFPVLFGTLSFALEGTALIFGIQDKMKRPHQFSSAMTLSMIIIIVMYWLVGFGSYMLYRDDTTSPIIASIPNDNFWGVFVKLSLSISILFTLPYQFYPISEYIASFIDTDEDFCHHRNDSSVASSPSSPSSPSSSLSSSSSSQQPNQQTDSFDHHDNKQDDPQDFKDVNIDLHCDNDGYINVTSHHQSQQSQQSQQQSHLPHHPLTSNGDHPHHLNERGQNYKFVGQLSVLGCALLIAIFFPDFHLVLSLFGCLATSSLAFILPCIFWLLTILRGDMLLRSHPAFGRQVGGNGVGYGDLIRYHSIQKKAKRMYQELISVLSLYQHQKNDDNISLISHDIMSTDEEEGSDYSDHQTNNTLTPPITTTTTTTTITNNTGINNNNNYYQNTGKIKNNKKKRSNNKRKNNNTNNNNNGRGELLLSTHSHIDVTDFDSLTVIQNNPSNTISMGSDLGQLQTRLNIPRELYDLTRFSTSISNDSNVSNNGDTMIDDETYNDHMMTVIEKKSFWDTALSFFKNNDKEMVTRDEKNRIKIITLINSIESFLQQIDDYNIIHFPINHIYFYSRQGLPLNPEITLKNNAQAVIQYQFLVATGNASNNNQQFNPSQPSQSYFLNNHHDNNNNDNSSGNQFNMLGERVINSKVLPHINASHTSNNASNNQNNSIHNRSQQFHHEEINSAHNNIHKDSKNIHNINDNNIDVDYKDDENDTYGRTSFNNSVGTLFDQRTHSKNNNHAYHEKTNINFLTPPAHLQSDLITSAKNPSNDLYIAPLDTNIERKMFMGQNHPNGDLFYTDTCDDNTNNNNDLLCTNNLDINNLNYGPSIIPPPPISFFPLVKRAVLPTVVIVVGIAASIVGVIDSGRQLLEHFF